MLGSCRDLILIEPGWLLGSATSLPKHSPGNQERVARDLGSTRPASILGEQGGGSRSRETRENITLVLGHYGIARTVLVAGSTSTGSWDLPTIAGLLCTEQPGKLTASGGRRLVSDSWQQLQQHIPMGTDRGRCPLARPCQVLHHGHPECAMSHSGTYITKTGAPRAWNLYTQPSQVQLGTQHLNTGHWAHSASTHSLAHNT